MRNKQNLFRTQNIQDCVFKKIKPFVPNNIDTFGQVGAIMPSSSFLARQMTKKITKRTKIVVELGPGNGSFTQHILNKMPRNGTLLAIEKNKKMAVALKKSVFDQRLIVIVGDAIHTGRYLQQYKLGKAHAIISGIPLGHMSSKSQNLLLKQIKSCLREKGIFMQFQYFLSSYLRVRRFFDCKITCYELRNIPPAFVYYCT